MLCHIHVVQLVKYSPVYNVIIFLCPTREIEAAKLAYKPGILYSLLDLFAKYFHVLSIDDSEAESAVSIY